MIRFYEKSQCDGVRLIREPLLGAGQLLEKIAALLAGNLTKLPDLPGAGGAHEAVGLQHGHPVVNLPHDDELILGDGDVWAGAVPVHVQESHLQGFLAKELETHLLILQDLLHRHQSVTRLLLLRQLGDPRQDDKVAPAETGHHLTSGLTLLAVVVLGKGAHPFARLFGLKVVLVAAAASVDKRLALFEGVAVGPPMFVGLAGSLNAGEATRSRQLSPAGQHAVIIGVEMVPVLIALTVSEGEAIVPA